VVVALSTPFFYGPSRPFSSRALGIAPREADQALPASPPGQGLGKPNDVAPMVALLVWPHGGWITGQVLSVSGGFSLV